MHATCTAHLILFEPIKFGKVYLQMMKLSSV